MNRELTIQEMMQEVLCNYGNTAFLRRTKEHDFDSVRGTAIWKLWYGEHFTDFCVRTMEGEYKKALQDPELMPVFADNLKKLLNSLKVEFDRYIMQKEGKYYGTN